MFDVIVIIIHFLARHFRGLSAALAYEIIEHSSAARWSIVQISVLLQLIALSLIFPEPGTAVSLLSLLLQDFFLVCALVLLNRKFYKLIVILVFDRYLCTV